MAQWWKDAPMRRQIPILVAVAVVTFIASGARASEPQQVDCSSSACVYLPAIIRPAVTLLPNGDFEQDAVGWFDPGGSITDALPNGVTAHSGTFALWLHRVAGQKAPNVEREITVPVNNSYLSYWIWVRPSPQCALDAAIVAFDVGYNALFDQIGMCAATPGWVNRTFDLEFYQGVSGKLSFGAATFDGTPPTGELLIDDVGFRIAP